MIFGIGVDVLEAARIKRTFERFGERFVAHLLLPEERAQLAHTVGHAGLIGALRRISGGRQAARPIGEA